MSDGYYWELTLMSGDKIPIPPEYVDVVKQKWANKENIATSRQVIPAHQIVNFEQTSRRRVEGKLLEEVARAFKDPIVKERRYADGSTDEAVKARWVKKDVTQREWDKYYSANGYKLLRRDAGVVTVAFVVAAHLVDLDRVEYCTKEEEAKLTK